MRRLLPGALSLAVLVSACAGLKPAPPPGAPSAVRLDEVRGALEQRRRDLRSLRAFARFAYASPQEDHKGRQLLLLRRPDRLRSELFSPFGSVFVLAAHGGRLTAYAPREKAAWEGAASARNLARYTGLALDVPTVVDLLLGIPPLEAGERTSLQEDAGAIKLLEWRDDAVSAAWFDPALLPLRYELRDAEGYVQARASFGEWTEPAGPRVPRQVSIEVPPSHQSVEITLSDPEVNVELADALFRIDLPAAIRRFDLDAE